MKIFNKKEVSKILSSENTQDLKNNLKIQDEDNYIEKLSKLYRGTLYIPDNAEL